MLSPNLGLLRERTWTPAPTEVCQRVQLGPRRQKTKVSKRRFAPREPRERDRDGRIEVGSGVDTRFAKETSTKSQKTRK